MPAQNMSFRNLIILSYKRLKNNCRVMVSLNSPYLPKDRSSKRNSIVINPLPRSFIHQRRLPFIMGEETRSRHHTNTHFVTKCHTPQSILRAHSSFQNHLLSPKRPTRPPSFLSKMVFDPEF